MGRLGWADSDGQTRTAAYRSVPLAGQNESWPNSEQRCHYVRALNKVEGDPARR
jgi:hypothetical protein